MRSGAGRRWRLWAPPRRAPGSATPAQPSGRARSGDGLVGVHHDALDTNRVAESLQNGHELHRRAVRVGDDPLVPLAVFRVHLADDERNVGLHPPPVRVVDHGCPARCRFRGELRETSVPAEKRAMSTPSNASGVASPIVRVRPSALTVEPAERPDASSRSSRTGNGVLPEPGSSFDRRRQSHRRPPRSAIAGLGTWLHLRCVLAGQAPEYTSDRRTSRR